VLARRRRLLVVAVPLVIVFLAVSFVVARFLTTENKERNAIYDVLRAEAAGDAGRVLEQLDDCDAVCAAKVRAFAPRLRGDAAVKIARLDSRTSYSLGDDTGFSRVVWVAGVKARPVVQCVLVRRRGSPLTGRSVSLLALTAPLADNEDPCPTDPS
jgi:hypothetical protein